jgi:hypothetical protein
LSRKKVLRGVECIFAGGGKRRKREKEGHGGGRFYNLHTPHPTLTTPMGTIPHHTTPHQTSPAAHSSVSVSEPSPLLLPPTGQSPLAARVRTGDRPARPRAPERAPARVPPTPLHFTCYFAAAAAAAAAAVATAAPAYLLMLRWLVSTGCTTLVNWPCLVGEAPAAAAAVCA